VIADANGLNAGEGLKAGKTLTLPNSVKTGTITADNHRVYSESEIVGSTLPNLKTPPPPSSGGCGSILMIIIVVVIAVVAAAFVGPLALALLNVVGAVGAIATVAAYAVAGALIAAAASIVQQGIFIALGYQESFSWKQVGNAAIAGAISGAAQGIGAAAQTAATAGKLSAEGAQYAKVASAALKASSVAVKQILDGGKITSWTSLASAAIGGYLEAGQSIASGADEAAKAAALGGNYDALVRAGEVSEVATQGASALTAVNSYVTPWVQLAETYVRNDHKLTPLDWATAVGSTLSAAVTQGPKDPLKGLTPAEELANTARHLATNLLVAGALRHYDKDASQSYFENSVGQEVGQFIGGMIVRGLRATLFAPKPKAAATANAEQGAGRERVQVASSGAIMSDVGGTYGEVNFGEPIGSTSEGEATFDALMARLQNPTDEAGPPIMLDDFGNPIAPTGEANGGAGKTPEPEPISPQAAATAPEEPSDGRDTAFVAEVLGKGKHASRAEVEQMQLILRDAGYGLGNSGAAGDGVDGLLGGSNSHTRTAARDFLANAEPLGLEAVQELSPGAVLALRNAGERNVTVGNKILPNTNVLSEHVGYSPADLRSVTPAERTENLDAVQPFVNAANQKYPNVPVDVINAVIINESQGLANAVSRTGALGIMQITSQNYLEGAGYNPFDPEQAIPAGTKLLSQYISKYGSDDEGINKALTAYNQGIGPVETAIAQARTAKTANWIQFLPTQEGKDYATNIRSIGQGQAYRTPGYFGTPP
jgi:hypothetical protein